MSKKKILIIRAKPLKLFIHCIPAFNAIRKFHANDEITILTEKSLVGVSKRSKLFDKVWLDSKPEWFQFVAVKNLAKKLKAANFDMVYDLQNDDRSTWYFKLLGFTKPKWNSSVVDWCSHYSKVDDYNIHFQDLISKQLRVAGIKEVPQIDISFMANDEAKELPEKFVMICAGGDRGKPAHKWDPLKYADIIDMLHEKHALTCVLVGDKGDDNLINSLIASSCIKAKPINFSGKTSINGLVAVAKKAIFCLGNETTSTHIAAFSGTKTIMICSRFSAPDLISPRVNNLAIVEEPALENVVIERVVRAVEEFGLTNNDQQSFQPFKLASKDKLVSKE